MTNSQDSTTTSTSCFSSIFRRLVCAGGLPTHPSSDADNPTNQQNTDDIVSDDSSIKLQLPPSPTRNTTTPAGIVARLMGLDSFPNSPRSTKVSLATIMRKSKSVNSLDFLPNFDIAPHHRRIQTSLSFRQLPATTFLQSSHHDHDHLGKVDAVRKSDRGLSLTPILEEKSKNLNSNKNKNKKINTNKIKRRQSQSVTSLKLKSEEEEEMMSCVKLKCTKKKGGNAAKKKVSGDGFPEEQKKKKKKKYKSRNTRYNHEHPLPKMGKHAHDGRKCKKKSMLKRRESEYSEEYCIKVLADVCRLTMVEMKGGVWVDTKALNNRQEISYEISQEILQVLVYEIVHDLALSTYE